MMIGNEVDMISATSDSGLFKVEGSNDLVFYYLDFTQTILHRVGGPAKVSPTTAEWWVNGKRHRLDGPALTFSFLDLNINPQILEEWWVNGERHRIDGPAISLSDGHAEWYENGKRHRVDGPAIEYKDGNTEWWYKGKRHSTVAPAISRAGGLSELWYQHGSLHREDGPAMTMIDGTLIWMYETKKHRLDGPAVEHFNGDKEWWVNGELHRLDGPAVVHKKKYRDTREWHLFGYETTKHQMRKFSKTLAQHFGKTDCNLIPYDILKTLYEAHMDTSNSEEMNS